MCDAKTSCKIPVKGVFIKRLRIYFVLSNMLSHINLILTIIRMSFTCKVPSGVIYITDAKRFKEFLLFLD